ncbi:MAG: PEP-CTERM system TPR-repeat protein PrsT [Colwellia sp.]|nr:PEP-CTERM system TPR-repeat protein PrsT [Colwellia sp.]
MNFLRSIVCASVILAVSACGNNETAQTHIAQAEKFLTAKENSSAIIALKNAIKLDVNNAKARFLLGRLYLASGDGYSAEKELERALQLKYDANKALPLLARAYMLTESDDDILSLAQEAESLTQASKIQFLAYKTLAALRADNDPLASETVKLVQSMSTADGYSMLASAYLEFSQKNIDYAAALVARILIATPNNADALMLQGQVAIVEGNYSQAVTSFEKYFALQPNSNKVQLFIADALLKNGQYPQAEAIADTILAKIPEQPFLQYIKAMARFEVKDYEAASHFSSLSLASGFSSFSLKLVAGASAFYLQNHEQCNLHLKDIIKYLPGDHVARRMLAVSQLQLGLIDDISETLGDFNLSNETNTQFLAMLSYELMERGAYEQAKELAKQVTASAVNAKQSARAGILKLMMNDPSGVENLELALQQNPELISAELALAFASIKSGDLARAETIANKWLKQYPNKAGGYNLKAKIAFAQNKLAQGQVALEQSLKLEPKNVYALTEMVKLANHQKKTAKAMALTEEAIVAHPRNLKVLAQYFEFHKNEEGLLVLIKAQQDNETNIKYGVLLAEALIKLNKPKRASAILAAYPLNSKTPKSYWQLMLIANGKQKDGQEAFLILDKWRKTNPYHIEPVLLLVNYWAGKKLPDRALNVLKHSFKQHPKNLMLHLVKMQVLLNSNRSTEARQSLKDLASFDIDKDLKAGIEGRILLLEKNFSAAAPKLKQQYEAKPSGQNVTFLAQALEGNKQQQTAIKLLESYSSEHGLQPRISLSLANLYLSADVNKAILEYKKLIKTQPNNIVVLNNLSWLYMEKGLFSQALKHAKKAYSLSAEVPNVVDTYAQVLLKSGKKAQALIKAEQAYKLSKAEDVDIALNLVETLLANNDKEQAKSILLKVSTKTKVQKEKYQQLTAQLM